MNSPNFKTKMFSSFDVCTRNIEDTFSPSSDQFSEFYLIWFPLNLNKVAMFGDAQCGHNRIVSRVFDTSGSRGGPGGPGPPRPPDLEAPDIQFGGPVYNLRAKQ